MPSLADRVLFYILVAVLAARPLIGETFELLQVSFLAALQAPAGPTPAATAWLDAILLATAALTLVRSAGWRHSRLVAAAIALLIAAVVLSSIMAADKPVAALAGGNIIGTVLAGGALFSLARAGWMRRLLLATLLALGAVTAVKCINQRLVEDPETRRHWETVAKPQLLQQGYDPNDPLLVNFERRMASGEVGGFLAHPNVTGSCLMMWLLIAAGLALAARAQPAHAIVALLLCGPLALALWFTGSRGAIGGGLFGLAALVLLGRTAPWSGRHAGRLLGVLTAAYLTVIAGGAAYGISKGTLPHASLAFRWQYWTAAARAIQEAPLTGIGRGNFAGAYLQYKAPESTEEVRDPHNLWVSLSTELGPLGLAAGMVLCAACVLAGLRSLAVRPQHAADPQRLTAGRALPVAIAIPLAQAVFSGLPWTELGATLAWVLDIGLPWVLALTVTIWLVRDPGSVSGFTAWLAAGACAGLLASLVHGLIDFPLLTPAGLAAFVLCAATAARPADSRPVCGRNLVPALVGVAAVALHVWQVVAPTTATARAVRHLETAFAAGPARVGHETALAAADRLLQSNPRDASAARRAATALAQLSRLPGGSRDRRLDLVTRALAYATIAAQRNPRDTNTYCLLAGIHEELARLHEQAGEVADANRARRDAAEAWEEAVQRYPTNPRTRISAGMAWREVWRRTADPEAARRSREHFVEALRIDATRLPQEAVRLREAERQTVGESLKELQAAIPPSPVP